MAAVVSREPDHDIDRAYPLATEVASIDEIAEIVRRVTAWAWRSVPQEAADFFAALAAAGGEPAYARCVYDLFARPGAGSIPQISDIFANVEQTTGKQPQS